MQDFLLKLRVTSTACIAVVLCFMQLTSFSQAYNKGPINITGSAYLASSITNTATATYLNNGSFYITGDFTNYQAGMSAGTGTIAFVGTSLENINSVASTVAPLFYNATVNNSNNVKMGTTDITINNIFYPQLGALQINSNTLNLAGTINNTGTGTISGDAAAAGTSNMNITGSGALGIMNFTTGFQVLKNFTLNRSSSGTATLGTDLSIGGITGTTNNGIASMNAGALVINGHILGLNGTLTGTGTFSGDASSVGSSALTIGGNLNTQLGTIYFTPGAQVLNAISINRVSGTIGNAVLGTNLTASNITLTYGVIATGANLFTFNNTGTLAQPQTSYAKNDATYTNSFIANCDASGTPQTGGAGPLSAFSGNVGFRIQNVPGNNSTDVYFPVGASFSPDDAGVVTTPNRMMLRSSYSAAEDFTVALDYGDIGNTPGPRINRIWYVKAGAANDSGYADMKLFYTNRGFAAWPTPENEMEAGFMPTDAAVVMKNYSGGTNFVNISGTNDITAGQYSSTSPTGESYAQYTIANYGLTAAGSGLTKGITTFNRFSIVNPNGIILPVSIINFRAYQFGKGVETEWTCVNERNMDHYEVQRSNNAMDFSSIGSVAALDNGQPSVMYHFFDADPANGNNFYRIKAFGKDGSISYTNIQLVTIGGGTADVRIFPNPVTSYNFTLQMNNMPAGKYALIIYNMLGQVIVSQEIERMAGSSSQTIYLPSGTARGVYKVSLINGTSKIIKTITVQ